MPLTSDSRLKYLLQRYIEGSYSAEEKDELLDLIDQAKHDQQIKQLMNQVWTRLSPSYQLNTEQSERILSGILPSYAEKKYKRPATKIRIIRWSAVAASILFLLTAAWVWSDRQKNKNTVTVLQPENDIAPNHSQAILILGNGTSIVLDSARSGVIAKQGGIPITKSSDQLSYNNHNDKSTETVYNTIVTPKGVQYRVVLPDGSKVWLNAASSLRFPTEFTAGRKVALTGEAYFEIAKDKDQPFQVSVNGMEVNVLGTRFNIMAYDNEPVTRTTLLAGSVQLANGKKQVILRPGQQASLDHSGNSHFEVGAADVRKAVAWKDGLFLFHNSNLRAALREVARWYNIEVVYDGNVHAYFNGMISRDTRLSQVLHMMEVTSDVSFKIEGKKIVVLPER